MAAEVLNESKDKLNETVKSDDYFDVIGKTWASKMRNLPSYTCLVAEKSINDILFDAEMGVLNVSQSTCSSIPFYGSQLQIQNSTSPCYQHSSTQFQAAFSNSNFQNHFINDQRPHYII